MKWENLKKLKNGDTIIYLSIIDESGEIKKM